MPVKHQIGAGGRIYTAPAATPETLTRVTGNDKTKFIKSLNINTAIATDDVTTLDADLDNFAQRFIAALSNSSGSMDCLYDAPSGSFLLYLDAVKNGNNHSMGRSKVNVIYDPNGSVTGYLSYAFTIIITAIPLTGDLGKAIGGQVSFQVDGPVVLSTVP